MFPYDYQPDRHPGRLDRVGRGVADASALLLFRAVGGNMGDGPPDRRRNPQTGRPMLSGRALLAAALLGGSAGLALLALLSLL